MDSGIRFKNRTQAGELLAAQLSHYKDIPNLAVLALPRGGVPVAYPIATQLRAPLDVFLVRKLGVPLHEELALGAIAEGGISIFNEAIIGELNITQAEIDAIKIDEQAELTRREQLYRKGKPPLLLKDKTIILVDDGLATGATMKAAITALHLTEPEQIIIAVPVAAADTYRIVRPQVQELISLTIPDNFLSVGAYYQDFSQTSDEEVIALLQAKHDGAVIL